MRLASTFLASAPVSTVSLIRFVSHQSGITGISTSFPHWVHDPRDHGPKTAIRSADFGHQTDRQGQRFFSPEEMRPISR
jgi:hypothetical protein